MHECKCVMDSLSMSERRFCAFAAALLCHWLSRTEWTPLRVKRYAEPSAPSEARLDRLKKVKLTVNQRETSWQKTFSKSQELRMKKCSARSWVRFPWKARVDHIYLHAKLQCNVREYFHLNTENDIKLVFFRFLTIFSPLIYCKFICDTGDAADSMKSERRLCL